MNFLCPRLCVVVALISFAAGWWLRGDIANYWGGEQ